MIYKLVTRVIQYFCFPERPMKGGDILDFQKGGGVNLRNGAGYDPPYQLCYHSSPKIVGPPLNLAPPKFNFLLRSPPYPSNYFGLEFLSPPKIRGAATMISRNHSSMLSLINLQKRKSCPKEALQQRQFVLILGS